MQKKYKRAIILLTTLVILFTLAGVLCSLSTVGINQYGLNYSTITSNFSDSLVYGPGLYYIGVSNVFLKVNSQQEVLSFRNLSTFTSDYYHLRADFSVVYMLNMSDFNSVSAFYVQFGETPSAVIAPLVKNEIISTISQYSSGYYQNKSTLAALSAGLETQIQARLEYILSTWSSISFNVLVESIVCEGISVNTDILDRNIQALLHSLQQAQEQKIDLNDYFTAVKEQKASEASRAYRIIAEKASRLQQYLSGETNTVSVAQLLYNSMPIKIEEGYINVLQQLIQIGNGTFPY